MLLALILIIGSPSESLGALRAGTYLTVAECNRRAADVQRVPGVKAAFCLPVDQ